jgi:hypothetical protein
MELKKIGLYIKETQILKLHHTIINLELGFKFNKSVDLLPNSITHLIFGKSFNQPVGNLPNSIIHLTFGNNFNQPIKKIPSNLKMINLGYNFTQILDENLIYLEEIYLSKKEQIQLLKKVPWGCKILDNHNNN